ncbi:MAG: hypothetical protein LBS99_03750, partial [Clostridiales bacterium]|nr:hypothetical protein [Clostridiales bacterium]
MERQFNERERVNDVTALPPRSNRFKDLAIFTERAVKMHGDGYYMRIFADSSAEFVRYDEIMKKWVFLCFPSGVGDTSR